MNNIVSIRRLCWIVAHKEPTHIERITNIVHTKVEIALTEHRKNRKLTNVEKKAIYRKHGVGPRPTKPPDPHPLITL